jgi:hypothetical protein
MKRKEGGRRRPWGRAGASPVAVADRGRPRAAHRLLAAVCCRQRLRDKGRRKKHLGFSRGSAVSAFFISPKGKGRRRIQAGGIRRLRLAAATSGCWAAIWPRRAARGLLWQPARRFSGREPRRGGKGGLGPVLACGLKREAVNSNFYQFWLIFFRSNC